MTAKRMQANDHDEVYGIHDVEHDYDPVSCEHPPKCKPVASRESEPTFTVYDDPPSHYDGGGVQPWDVIEAFQLDYWTGNILKYTCRAGKKDGESRLKDLKKIRNFVNKAIELEEKKS